MSPLAAGLSPAPSAPPSPATCAAVVVHYRDARLTGRCVASLLAQAEPLDVIVVDNCSPDGSGAQLEHHFAGNERVHFVRSATNGGFGAGCNQGITFALRRSPGLLHVLLLNPDADMAPGTLGELLATSDRHPHAGIVGCRIDDEAGRAWFANGRLPRWTLRGFHCAAPAADEHRSEFVTGACMLLRADLLRAGLRFHEGYFLYCEDAELCCDVLSRGRELWVTQRARVRHVGGGSQTGALVLDEFTGERLYWLTRAKVIFARRRLPTLQQCAFFAVAAVLKPLAGLLRSRSLRFLGPYYRGLWSGLCAAVRDPGAAGAPPTA